MENQADFLLTNLVALYLGLDMSVKAVTEFCRRLLALKEHKTPSKGYKLMAFYSASNRFRTRAPPPALLPLSSAQRETSLLPVLLTPQVGGFYCLQNRYTTFRPTLKLGKLH